MTSGNNWATKIGRKVKLGNKKEKNDFTKCKKDRHLTNKGKQVTFRCRM